MHFFIHTVQAASESELPNGLPESIEHLHLMQKHKQDNPTSRASVRTCLSALNAAVTSVLCRYGQVPMTTALIAVSSIMSCQLSSACGTSDCRFPSLTTVSNRVLLAQESLLVQTARCARRTGSPAAGFHAAVCGQDRIFNNVSVHESDCQ